MGMDYNQMESKPLQFVGRRMGGKAGVHFKGILETYRLCHTCNDTCPERISTIK
jgi:hypothetical protein